eukprot:CAMPEP_0195100980 /NCGR_PEP_ID=MMETSP0448-20130528/64844_1 /TAXON_ID=66468 /ORGANISM="Heterocapsa triquestra, Strain CCMP 448" /LENGTH=70 /DNA_ID=CAMNT_0040136219 /DNA_START=42 /DNA_END=251 /DNA_ORIENTATION=-
MCPGRRRGAACACLLKPYPEARGPREEVVSRRKGGRIAEAERDGEGAAQRRLRFKRGPRRKVESCGGGTL